ncbi:MAG: hypothetical protein KY396_02910 [Actinobacteria bacterium]|nr:hypothetical protein [Actinomycetota bacterium]
MTGNRFSLFRFFALATFIVAVAAGLWLYAPEWYLIVATMTAALLIAWTIEWLAWREPQGRWDAPDRGVEPAERRSDVTRVPNSPREEAVPAALPAAEPRKTEVRPHSPDRLPEAAAQEAPARAAAPAAVRSWPAWARSLLTRSEHAPSEPREAAQEGADVELEPPALGGPLPDAREPSPAADEALEEATPDPAPVAPRPPDLEPEPVPAAEPEPRPQPQRQPEPEPRVADEPERPAPAGAGSSDAAPEPGEREAREPGERQEPEPEPEREPATAAPEPAIAPTSGGEPTAPEATDVPPPTAPAVPAPTPPAAPPGRPPALPGPTARPPIRAVPTPPPGRQTQGPPARAAGPAAAPGAPVATLPRRTEPREWNVWELDALAREASRRVPERATEWSYLLLHLREFADPGGALPREFDAVVRESFGGLLERIDRR